MEETEERARVVPISCEDSESSSNSSLSIDTEWVEGNSTVTEVKSNAPAAEDAEEQLDHAEELITGDSDDPPLSEEAAVEMVRKT